MDAYERLRGWWERTGAGIVPGAASDEQIEGLEGRYGITLPGDFRAYLQTTCPSNHAWGKQDARWWNFGEIKNISDEYEYKLHNPVIARHAGQHLFFLGFLLWSHAWAISCAAGENYGRIALVNGGSDCYVADSLLDFIERYTDDRYFACTGGLPE